MSASALTGFDYVIFAIIGISTLFAFFKGAIKTSLSLIGWVVAATVTIVSLPAVKAILLKHYPHNEVLVNFLAPSGIFFVVLIIVAIINYQILLLASPIRGGMVDRSLGFAIGLARGAFFSCIIFIMIATLSPVLGLNKSNKDKPSTETGLGAGVPEWIQESKSYKPLKNASEVIMSKLPKSVNASIAKFLPKAKTTDQAADLALDPSKDQLGTLNNIIKALPKDALTGIKMPDMNAMTPEERDKLIRTALEAYNSAVKEGDLDKKLQVPEEQIKELEKSVAEKTYDAKQRNEIDRLIKIAK